MIAWLWSHNRDGVPQATFSHQTAASLHGIDRGDHGHIHLTVLVGFRRKPSEKAVILHQENLAEEDRVSLDIFSVTSPEKTRRDLKRPPPASAPSPKRENKSDSVDPNEPAPAPTSGDWAAWS